MKPRMLSVGAALLAAHACFPADDSFFDPNLPSGALTRGGIGAASLAAAVPNTDPEIHLYQGTTPLENGATFDFGQKNQFTFEDQTFRIVNLGGRALTLSGNPFVAVSGADPAEFSVVQPTVGSIPWLAFAAFTVRFERSGSGPKFATLTIGSNDADEAAYTIFLQGDSFCPLC